MTTPPPGDLGRQVLTLATDLADVTRRLRELGDPATLRAQVTGLKRQVATITASDSGGISALAAAVGALTDRITALEDTLSQRGDSELWDFTGLPGSFDGQAREAAWEQLTGWVGDVLGGVYQLTIPPGQARQLPGPHDGYRLPPCWSRHPDLVADLAWLAQEWIRLYRTPYGTPARAGDWHDRHLPGLRRRLSHSTAAACLRGGKHVTPDPDGQ